MSDPQFPRRNHRAHRALEQWSAAHPDIWQLVDAVRLAPHTEWASHMFMPLDLAGRIMLRYCLDRGERPAHEGDLVQRASLLNLFCAWRLTKGIYRYDPALYEAVVQTPLGGDIPAALLRRLPQWCVYLETPGQTVPTWGGGETGLYGVWAWLDHRLKDGSELLSLGMDTDAPVGIRHVPLVGTLEQSVAKTVADWRSAVERGTIEGLLPQGFADRSRKCFAPILSLLLYLCSDVSEIGEGTHRPANPQPRRTRNGWRFTTAEKLTTWNVGVSIGAAVRRAQQAQEMEQNLTPMDEHARPNGRYGYWQTFLPDPQNSERRVKWLPPDPDRH